METLNGQPRQGLHPPDLKSEDFLQVILTALREAVRQQCESYLHDLEAEVEAEVNRRLEADRQAINCREEQLAAAESEFEVRVRQEADRRTEYERKKIEKEREEFDANRLKMTKRFGRSQALVDRYCLALEKVRSVIIDLLESDDIDCVEDLQPEFERMVQTITKALRDE